MIDPRAKLPAVGRLLTRADVASLIASFGRETVTDALRHAIGAAREGAIDADANAVVRAATAALAGASRGTLVPVINATGVVLHTNLGRAPLSEEACAAAVAAGAGYCSLEFDLDAGERGSRHVHAAARLRRLTGAEDALVANNAAAGLILSLATLAAGGPVIVSRGELVEIGGAFRIPDIITSGGARLVEVGTTNRTRLSDYVRALDAHADVPGGVPTGRPPVVLLKVHRSNFDIVGFTEQVEVRDLAIAARAREPRPAVVYDLGSGLLVPGATIGLPNEPDVPGAIAAGADVVLFSGDKLLGGPQAGIIVGRSDLVERMRRHPLMRAVRAGKLVLAALDATLAVYERGLDAARTLPTLRALAEPEEVVRARATRLAALLSEDGDAGEVVPTSARVGAGAQPTATVPSWAVRLPDERPDDLARELRRATPVVVGRIEGGALLLDVRAVGDDAVEALSRSVLGSRAVLRGGGPRALGGEDFSRPSRPGAGGPVGAYAPGGPPCTPPLPRRFRYRAGK